VPKYRNVCPPVIEKDVYPDCPFGCVYCIARTEAPAPETAVTDEAVLEEAAARDVPVYLSPWSDAYPPAELRSGRTRALLEGLRRRGCAFYVITKSDAILRDAALFADYPRSFVAISLNSADDNISRRLEPRAPGAARRLEVIASLIALKTVKVVVKIDPILPGVTDGACLDRLLTRLIKLRPVAVTAETLRLNRAIKNNLFQSLSTGERDRLDRYYPAAGEKPAHAPLDYRVTLFKSLEKTLAQEGIRTAFCRASLSVPINANDCRGGY
jgi:DNA repair photolyase